MAPRTPDPRVTVSEHLHSMPARDARHDLLAHDQLAALGALIALAIAPKVEEARHGTR